VTGDVDELIQVFSNLIENACKYGQTGKRVEISVSGAEPGGAQVSVRDFGPGIAKEHVPRLTERFYRVDVETSRAKKGHRSRPGDRQTYPDPSPCPADDPLRSGGRIGLYCQIQCRKTGASSSTSDLYQ
jgi:hypothetical protein